MSDSDSLSRISATQQGALAYLQLSRSDKLNAMDETMLLELSRAFGGIKNDPSVRVVIVHGAGRTFSAGADISMLGSLSPMENRRVALLACDAFAAIETLGKPVIAAVHGYALGGGFELSQSCSLRVAAEGARFGAPEVSIGCLASWGGTTRLARIVGKGVAYELLLTGRQMDAAEAHRIGFVNRLAPPGRHLETAEALAAEITKNAPLSVQLTLEAVHDGLEMPLERAARLSADLFGVLASTRDLQEGTAAFLEKRPPCWAGR